MDIKQEDLFVVADAQIENHGHTAHNCNSMNSFYDYGVFQIVTQCFNIEKIIDPSRLKLVEGEKDVKCVTVNVRFTSTKLEKPSTFNYATSSKIKLFPLTAILEDKTYAGELKVNATIRAVLQKMNGEEIVREDTVKDQKLCNVPIMVRSKYCNTYGLSKEALTNLHEDPNEPGGYFIIKGNEWIIDSVENIIFNEIRIFNNEGHEKEILHCDFISRPGDAYLNSDYIITRCLSDNQITCEVYRNDLKGIHIPFFALFRLLGVCTDEEIYRAITWEFESDIAINMINYINAAFNARYPKKFDEFKTKFDQAQTARHLAFTQKDDGFKNYKLDEDTGFNYTQAVSKIMYNIDMYLLPHIGNNAEHRPEKARFLGLILRKILLVRMGVLPTTDRDSYVNKRVLPAGVNFAKSFKTHFNTVVGKIKERIMREFKSTEFNRVVLTNFVSSEVHGTEFEKNIAQSITSGTKTQLKIGVKRTITNRLSSQLLKRSNQEAMMIMLRQITVNPSESAKSAKQSKRAREMCYVLLSGTGFVCPIHSPTSERVGKSKQLALIASIAETSSSPIIRQLLLEDQLCLPIEKATYNDISKMASVFVNGDWVCLTTNSRDLLRKYRQMRRDLKIDPTITITWNNILDEISFWCDAGRMFRPLLIVYNSTQASGDSASDDSASSDSGMSKDRASSDSGMSKDRASSDAHFEQGIRLTKQHIVDILSKKKTIIDLLKEQIIEYITPDEQINCYVCPSFNQLMEDRNNPLRKYTHCDIPECQLGLDGLICPFTSNTHLARITYECNLAKQSGGCYALNWPFRVDKEAFLQYNNEYPLVQTVVNRYLYPNGCNIIVAVMSYAGYNLEDSIIISKGLIDRGFFDGSKFTFVKTELEQKEEFRIPDASNTQNIKSANYSKLDSNGLIKVGSIVEINDVIIGKVVKLAKGANGMDSEFKYSDRSVVYKEREPSIVYNVIDSRNEDSERFVKVGLRHVRNIIVGDKMCIPNTDEILTDAGWIQLRDLDIEHHCIATMRCHKATSASTALARPCKQGAELTYERATRKYEYEHCGDMYYARGEGYDISCTLEHRNFVQLSPSTPSEFVKAVDLYGRDAQFSSSARNSYRHTSVIELDYIECDMTTWLQFMALYFTRGTICDDAHPGAHHDAQLMIVFDITNVRHLAIEILSVLSLISTFECNMYETCAYVCMPASYLDKLTATDGSLPSFTWRLSYRHADTLLQTIYDISKLQFITLASANEISRLALHAGRAAQITPQYSEGSSKIDKYVVSFIKRPKKCTCVHVQRTRVEKIEHYDGIVGCIELPTGLFYTRRNAFSPPIWTGNSSRSGQKGITALIMKESDMPFMPDGTRVSLIFNPHGIPSRMTVSQLYESAASKVCATKGVVTDATIFRDISIDTIAASLRSCGLQEHGYETLYSGITGEQIDSQIFTGIVFYQRIQKFVNDIIYAVSQCAIDPMTRQPLEGKGSSGSMKIGEMELQCLATHGSARIIAEKFMNDSDGFIEWRCRCGRAAIVNPKKGIYKCKACKDNAEIYSVPTTWSAKLFRQELETMNVGARCMLKPFEF